AQAGAYAAILAPYSLFALTSTPLVQVINIVSSQLTFLLINFFRLSGLLLLFFLGGYFDFSASDFVMGISIFSTLFFIFITVLILCFVNIEARRSNEVR